MARLTTNSVLNNISGRLGKQLVFKQYADKTVVSKYPDMSRVKASIRQKNNRSLFREATAYAKKIIRNPELKAAYKEKTGPGQTVYNYAMREYMLQHK